MDKKFLKKIIAQSPEDLQMISACCSEGKVKISDIKYLPSNKIFLISILRKDRENEDDNKKINIRGNKAIIEGTNNLEGAELMSSDLRASVALVLAAFISKGTSIINRVYHLDRGYEKIENKLKKIGVRIKRLS